MSKSDFIFGLDSLKIKLTSADSAAVFTFLDKNHDGYVSYSEFCWMSEEKRRGLDFPPLEEASVKASSLHYIDDDVERMSNAS